MTERRIFVIRSDMSRRGFLQLVPNHDSKEREDERKIQTRPSTEEGQERKEARRRWYEQLKKEYHLDVKNTFAPHIKESIGRVFWGRLAEINSEVLADGFSPLTVEKWREFLYTVGGRHPKTLHYQLLQENGYLRELKQFTIRKP